MVRKVRINPKIKDLLFQKRFLVEKLSLKKFGEKYNISPETLRRIEGGMIDKISFKNIDKVCSILDLDIKDIYIITNENETKN